MLHTTSLQLKALLAMPTALRPVLLLGAFAPCRSQWTQSRFFASSLPHGAPKHPNVAALVIPEFRTASIAEIAPEDLFKTSSLTSAPGQPLEGELTKLYTKNPATFVYAESDFYKLKKNTRVPEVCVLGRSNVGKSSFVNGLAHRPNNGLAFVSSKAGKTRSINMYGFGPAPTIKELQAQGSRYKDEDIPIHTFHLVDMPGYGHASLKEWGKNISLYLNKRSAVKGAILLIDAEVGPKDSDLHLLQVLCTAQLKTAIVLTKADKVKKGLEGLRATCKKVWDTLHTIETRTTEGTWVWEKDVYVTAVGARDSNVVRSTVTTARLAVARLAGLVTDERPDVAKNQRWSGKMVSFDDLQYAPSKSDVPETNANTAKPAQAVWNVPFPPRNTPGSVKAQSAFADLDQAAKAQHASPARISGGLGARNWLGKGRAQARAFHSTSVRCTQNPQNRPSRAELKAVIDEFLASLKADAERDRVRRLQQDRVENPPRPFKKSMKQLEERQARKLRRKFPEQTIRARAVFDRRLEIEEERRQEEAAKEAMEKDWRASNKANKANNANNANKEDKEDTEDDVEDEDQAMDADEFEEVFAASEGLEDTEKQKKNKRKKSRK